MWLIPITKEFTHIEYFCTVVPVAQINLSGNVTKVGGSSVMRVGGSVTITCTGAGEGSPPPTNFTLTHEGNQLTSLDGTYTIPSVEKKHSGKYGCVPKTVLSEYPKDPLQGDEVSVQLTVYGKIASIYYTIHTPTN